MTETFDVAILGTGNAGIAAAARGLGELVTAYPAFAADIKHML